MSSDGADELLCILITDLVGWTELGDQRGDEIAHHLRQEHFGDVRSALSAHQGREVKTAGDSVLATFRSAVQAVRCATTIQAAAATTDLQVRIGVHAGEPISDEDDVFGTVVNVTSRLCAAADGGDIVVSDTVRSLVGRRGDFTFEDLGKLSLKGVEEPLAAARLRVGVGRAAPAPASNLNPGAMRPERTMLCPVVVGRAAERQTLADALSSAADGHGGLVVLAGEAGMGKSRLARDARERAVELGMVVLSGRCVPGASPVPYRPLTEAFASRFRDSPPPTDTRLAGFGIHLGRLVPHWRTEGPDGVDESAVLLGEAVVRLAQLAGGGSTLLVLEDVHWADVESLAVVEYLADALHDQPVLCLCTTRVEGRAVDALARLRRNEAVVMLGLDGLPADDVRQIVDACLGEGDVPADLAAWIEARSDGISFLIEELLAGLVASGTLARDAHGWTTTGRLEASVPFDAGESIRRRLAVLDPAAKRVIRAAAMLGRRFEWDLLPGVAEVDGRAAVDALRAAVDAQIVAVEGEGFLFRHALSRDAVLGELLPPERRDLASRAGPAVERANPGLPGAVCELAAELAEAAGDHGKAAERLIESARRALVSGAFATAEATAERARRLAPPGAAVALDADLMLVRILAAAGKPAAALALGSPLVSQVRARGRAEAVEVQLELARAARGAGDVAAAAELTAAARTDLDGELALAAQLDAVTAYVALDQGRVDEAVELAERAVEAAAAADQPAAACEALEVLGRIAQLEDVPSALAHYRRAAELAARHGLAGWELRARHELALHAWGDGDLRPLREVRDLAARTGALVTQAVMDLSLADVALAGFERDACLAAARSCVEASRRYGLATEPVAHLWLAGGHALAGDDEAMEASIADALARDPQDPRILGDLHGRVYVTRAFVSGELGALPTHLDTMMRYVELTPPGTSIFPARQLWGTVHATHDDDLGVSALADCRRWADATPMPSVRTAALAVEAIVRGRQGDAEAAAALAERTRIDRDALAVGAGLRHCQQLLAAIAALRDGWGDPIAWLRESEAFFASGGYELTARRCRTLIGEAGAPVPRRRASGTVVPPVLRALGVTSRELDVLTLVVEGCTTRDIAGRLFLSPKTVERHLANLFDRTGVRNRAALADLARSHGIGAP
ncbi:MAG: AAA family ATPase [Acidimicrobiales bacterium]|nr:AAA family ATPase [Acidimicrobiales bacterium]